MARLYPAGIKAAVKITISTDEMKIETAKANGVEPYDYLKRVFKELPAAIAADDGDAITRLLPWNIVEE